jgi:hypothetical protein
MEWSYFAMYFELFSGLSEARCRLGIPPSSQPDQAARHGLADLDAVHAG